MAVNAQLIDNLKTEVKVVRDNVEDVNASLKKILTKIRTPGKLICDIILILTLAIMIGMLIWTVQYYNSLRSIGS